MRKAIVILTAALALTAIGGLRPARAEKWALLVGINDYEASQIPDLRGCENDVKLMQMVLTQKFGFPQKNIRTVLSRDATKKRILEEFDNWLVKQAKPGDVVLFHFSGHGSQAPDDNGDEPDDRMDETLCPTNIRTSAAFDDIRDEEFGAVINKLKASSITIILDCCHSGTGTRDLDDLLSPVRVPTDAQGRPMTTRTRMVIRPELLNLADNELPASELTTAGMFLGDFTRPGAGTRALQEQAGTRDAEMNYTLITGCRAEQTSADAPFPMEGNKYYYFGALTYNLVGALMQVDPSDPSWTYERVIAEAVKNLKRKNFKQDPQLEGLAKARVFWAPPITQTPAPTATQTAQQTPPPPPQPSKPFILITNVGGDRVELGAGVAAGITAKSVYTIYEPDDYKLEGPGIALAEVSAVYNGTSIAVLKRADAKKLRKGCRAVETLHYYPPTKLYLTSVGPKKEQVEAAIKAKCPFVSIAPSLQEFTDRVLRIEEKDGKLSGWLVNMEGRRFQQHTANTPAQLADALYRDLSNAFIIKQLTQLDNPAAAFKVKVWVEGPATKWEGENIVFKFKADRDCYLNLIDCGTSGQVTVLFPNAYHKDNRIQGGKEYSIPSAEMGFDIQTQGPSGREMVKAIATLRPLNLLNFDFNQLTKENNAGFLTRTLDESAGDAVKMGQTMSRSLGGDLATGTRSKDFKIVKRPDPPAPPAPAVVQVSQPLPPKPPAATVPAQPVKPPAQPVPVEVTPQQIPTTGWATDSVLVDVKTKGV
ncbi:MAG TPA: caspase family protein [Armatimonadota bacterium]|nr:caspase family protein [Armatimonadota bacterium]